MVLDLSLFLCAFNKVYLCRLDAKPLHFDKAFPQPTPQKAYTRDAASPRAAGVRHPGSEARRCRQILKTSIIDFYLPACVGHLPGIRTYNTRLCVLEAFAELYRAWPDPLVRRRLTELLIRAALVLLGQVVLEGPVRSIGVFAHRRASRGWM